MMRFSPYGQQFFLWANRGAKDRFSTVTPWPWWNIAVWEIGVPSNFKHKILKLIVIPSLIHVWHFATLWSCMPGFPVLHHLPELAQTHVHWVGDSQIGREQNRVEIWELSGIERPEWMTRNILLNLKSTLYRKQGSCYGNCFVFILSYQN